MCTSVLSRPLRSRLAGERPFPFAWLPGGDALLHRSGDRGRIPSTRTTQLYDRRREELNSSISPGSGFEVILSITGKLALSADGIPINDQSLAPIWHGRIGALVLGRLGGIGLDLKAGTARSGVGVGPHFIHEPGFFGEKSV